MMVLSDFMLDNFKLLFHIGISGCCSSRYSYISVLWCVNVFIETDISFIVIENVSMDLLVQLWVLELSSEI